MKRRTFFGLLPAIPLCLTSANLSAQPKPIKRIDDEFVVVNGWILKNTDLLPQDDGVKK